MNKRKESDRGFVLIACLLFIVIIMLWVNINLGISSLEFQIGFNQFINAQNAETVQAAASIAYHQFDSNRLQCRNETLSRGSILNQSGMWWLSDNTCHGVWNGQHFQYVYKPLGTTPCQTFDGKEGVQYWLLIIRVEQKLPKAMPFLAKVVFVQPKVLKERCKVTPEKLSSVWASFDLVEDV